MSSVLNQEVALSLGLNVHHGRRLLLDLSLVVFLLQGFHAGRHHFELHEDVAELIIAIGQGVGYRK